MNPISAPETDLKVMSGKIENYINELCVNISNRHPGKPGNNAATEFFRKTAESFGFQTQCDWFDCIDWQYGGVSLRAGSESFHANVGPYSNACDVSAELIEISTMTELREKDLDGKIVLIRGELAKEQLVPKGYPFYNVEEHSTIIQMLEDKHPVVIIAATDINPFGTGALSPFPLIEDARFDIPSAYMHKNEGERLSAFVDSNVSIKFESSRVPARACNVIARKGSDESKKIIICAHIDTKITTPGALDNASGIAIMLAIAEEMKDYSGVPQIELIAINGEDYYDACGEIEYLNLYKDKLKNVLLAINIDAPGYRDGDTQYSFYECSEQNKGKIKGVLSGHAGLSEGEPWPMSDHMVFVMNGVSAMAFTSEKFFDLCSNITHTEKDTPDVVDCEKLAQTAAAIKDIVLLYNE